jgi:hypothetical protein
MAEYDYLIQDLILFTVIAFIILMAIQNWFWTIIAIVIIYALWKKFIRGGKG